LGAAPPKKNYKEREDNLRGIKRITKREKITCGGLKELQRERR
jgi:hypothetical protein